MYCVQVYKNQGSHTGMDAISEESAINAALRPFQDENLALIAENRKLKDMLKKSQEKSAKLMNELDTSKHPTRAIPNILTAEGRQREAEWEKEKAQLLYRIEVLESKVPKYDAGEAIRNAQGDRVIPPSLSVAEEETTNDKPAGEAKAEDEVSAKPTPAEEVTKEATAKGEVAAES